MKQFLISIIIGAGVLIGLDQLTSLAIEWKIGIPVAVFLTGLLLSKVQWSESTSTPAPSPVPSSPTPTPSTPPAASSPAAAAETQTLQSAIAGILVSLLLLAGLVGVGFWLYRQLNDWIDKEAAKPTNRVVNLTPMGHDNIFIEDKEFKNWINPGIEYSVFELKKGWRWKWFMDKPIFWRVRTTGEEPFKIADEGGAEFSALRDGWLEIKSDYHNNWVSITRRIYRQTLIDSETNSE